MGSFRVAAFWSWFGCELFRSKSRRFLLRSVIGLIALLFVPGHAFTEDIEPGWVLGTADLVSPEDAQVYYDSLQAVASATDGTASAPQASSSSGVIAAPQATTITAPETESTPEIVALARALQNDPKLIYEFVHNNIDYVPYFGSLKGATLTLLERSGNDFDQASLMIALLRESGFTAQYTYGTMTLQNSDLANWFGVTNNNTVISLVLGSGGIPATMSSTTTTMTRVCVRATINSAYYLFDPAFKAYTETVGIDLATAMNYNKSALLSVAGGTVGTNNDISNLNDSALRSQLTSYTNSLIANLRTGHANASMEEIIGGRNITPEFITQHQYPTSWRFAYPNPSYWNTISDTYAHTVRIQSCTFDTTLKTTEIAGKRLTFHSIYVNPFVPSQLWLEDTVKATGSTNIDSYAPCDGPSHTLTLTLSINHPYAAVGDNGPGTYADTATDYTIRAQSVYTILSDFGGSKDGQLLEKRQRNLDSYRASGLTDTSRQVLDETLNIMGQTYMQQLTLSDNLIVQMGGVRRIVHHQFGLMAQEMTTSPAVGTGYYVNVASMFGSTISKNNNSAGRNAAFKTGTFLGSALEHGVLEQLQGADRPAASTIKLLSLANATSGQTIYKMNSANYATVKPLLLNYPATDFTRAKTGFNALINNGYTIILPKNANITLQQWKGEGYVIFKQSPNGDMWHGMVIAGGYFGGYGGVKQPPSVPYVCNEFTPELWHPVEIPTHKSFEPVDLTTGAYLLDHEDLALGMEEPNGLHFSRSYNSDNNTRKGVLGYGWTHSYDIYASKHSDIKSGLGLRQPVDAAALMVSYLVTLDLMTPSDLSAKEWMTGVLVGKWAMDQLLDNAVTMQLQNNALTYIKLPDGSYNPPPGLTTALSYTSGLYKLTERFGTVIDFNADKKISAWADVDGNVMSFTYDTTASKKLTQVKDSKNRTLTLGYTNDYLTSVADSSARTVYYGQNTNGNLTTFTDAAAKAWGYGYDATGHRLLRVKDPLLVTLATNTYDSQNDVATQIYPRQGGGTVTFNYYFSGFRNVEEDSNGDKTVYFLDRKGRTTAVQDAMGNVQTTVFDGQNHPVLTIDPRGNQTQFTYDGKLNLRFVTNALNQQTENVYDSLYRLTYTYDPLRHATRFGYDAKHHLLSTRDAVNNVFSSTYNTLGQADTSTDGRGTVTTYTYDTKGNPNTNTVANHPLVDQDYDAIGRRTKLTDQAGTATSFTYDNRNLLTQITYPQRYNPDHGPKQNFKTNLTYDNAGHLASRKDRNGATITYAYTPSGKLRLINYPTGTDVTFTHNTDWETVVTMADSLGTTTYGYDDANRPTSQTDPNNFSVGYDYDAADNLTKITYPGGKNVIYTYDELNRMKTVKIEWLNQTAEYFYDDASRLDYLINFNGTITDYSYDNANRLTGIAHTKGGVTIAAVQFPELDGNGNRKQEVRTEAQCPVDLTAQSLIYTYYTTDADKTRLWTAGPDTFVYDSEGQTITQGGMLYTWDYEHRLTSVDGVAAQYFYDGVGNRLQATRNSVTTKYVYDKSGNLLAETDNAGNISRYYIHGQGMQAFVEGNTAYVYHHDAVGNTVAITDGSGVVKNAYAYTPYGRATNKTETVTQPFQFAGQFGVMTETNGLLYMRARYYDPKIGRFLSEDPSGFDGGLNLYAYVGGNPIMGVDPSGLFTASVGIYGSAALGFGGGGGTALNFGYSEKDGFSFSLTGTAQGGAVAGAGASVGVGFTYTTANNVNQLNGISSTTGRAGLGPISVEGFKDSNYAGGTLTFDIGKPVGYTAGSVNASTTSAIYQYSNGVQSIGNTGSSSIWSSKGF